MLPLDILRDRTGELHRRAERTGIIRDILRGGASVRGYALLLRNLLPAYVALETGLVRVPALAELADADVFRAAALASDVAVLGGAGWEAALPLLPAAEHYRDTVVAARKDGGARLIAHAYVRYLGDLSGGLVMKGLLGSRLGIAPRALTLYDFAVADPVRLKERYRGALGRALQQSGAVASVAAEAERAFELNIALSEAVQAAA